MTKLLEFLGAFGIILRGRLGASSRLLAFILIFAVTYMVSGNAHVMAAGQQAENMVSTFSLRFDGADDRVTVPYDASFPTEVFTVSAWIKLTIPSGRAAIIARGEDDNSLNLSWQLYVTRDGNLEIMLEDANENNFCYPLNSCAPMGSCTVTGDLFVADDTWRHVVATRDTSGSLALYIDGEKRAGCDGTGVPSSNNFQDLSVGCTFGTIGPPPGGIEPPIWFFPGLIDEPAMWNAALSEVQVADVFNDGIDLLSTGLVGFWAFDEAAGQAVADLSPAGNDGFLGETLEVDSADPVWEAPSAAAGTFFVPPLDTGVVSNGARSFNLQLQNGSTEFFPGIFTATSGYNGNYLAPTLLMSTGDSVVMNVTNAMPFATTTHWHGMHLPARMDGGPHQAIQQDSTWVATWRIKNRASTYWYHPHPHPEGFPIDTLKATGWQVYQGLTGMLIVKDDESDTLGLPDEYGVDDIPIILQDRSFTDDSSAFAPVPPQGQGVANLRRGFTILVNGVVTPTLNSHAQMIRLRILNASNARTYRLGFSDNRSFSVVGSDGGILDTVSMVTRLDISPAERYEIVVDFSDANGSVIDLMSFNSEIESHSYPNGLTGNIYWVSPIQDAYDITDFHVMTFDIGSPTAGAVTSFNQGLTEIVRIDPATADNLASPRSFVLAAPAGDGNGFTINGLMFDALRIDDTIALGALEVWDVTNISNMAHPFHVHGNSFQVVSRTNGVRPVLDYELGWKDVVVVHSQETVRIIKSFEDYADPEEPYMSHCHILEHEDVGMMTHWIVVDLSCCVGNRGDFNGDGVDANILDLTYVVDRIFRGGSASVCPEEADINNDGTPANVLDLTFLVDWIFRGGPAPDSC